MARESFAVISTELPCLGDLENPEKLPVLEVLKVIHATWLRRNVSNGFLDLENLNNKEIVKIHKTKSSVPLEPEVNLDFQGHPNMVAW